MNQELSQLPDLGEFDPLAGSTLDGDMNAHRWKNDSKLTKRFRRVAVLNPHKSAEAGRAIFDEKDFITIWTPGSQLTVIDAPMDSGFYMQRFRKEYEAWKAGIASAASGTPLEHFPFLFSKVGLIAELKAMHIHTTEQLAELPDGALQNIMGGYELRKQALDWLNKTKVDAVDAEKAAMAKRLEELEAMVKQLAPAPVEAPKAAVKEK
jgi:hypothetical protein